MADNTAALVLALEARFDKFEKQMADLGKSVEKTAKQIEDKLAHAFGAVQDKLSSIAGGLAGQVGVFGTVLQRLGPAGIAAAVGLGAVAVAIKEIVEASTRLGERAVAIKEFSNA